MAIAISDVKPEKSVAHCTLPGPEKVRCSYVATYYEANAHALSCEMI